MSRLEFSEEAWESYIYLQSQDKKTLKKINQLLQDISRNGYNRGIGKTEALKGNLSGFFSKRIDKKNRIVYRITDNKIEIFQCGSHYGNN